MDEIADQRLTDEVILLGLLSASHAAEHLAGEDEAMAKWLSGGRSTLANVHDYIASNLENWRNNRPRRAFGVFHCATDRLIGSIEVNLARTLGPGQVNISYGIFPRWRGQRFAMRALNLMGEYLRATTDVRQMVLRIAPANTASISVAENAGFAFLGVFDELEGPMTRYVRDVKP